jgi:DNA-binding MurR/RpiR family transcriptional regulator
MSTVTNSLPAGDVASRLQQRGGSLSSAEQRVAEYLLSGGPGVVLLSAAKIAAELDLSDATVVRTAQALGYRGLGELKMAVAEQHEELTLGERLRGSLAEATKESVLTATISQQLEALELMSRRIDEEEFGSALTIAAAASRVVWCGIGPSAHLANYASLLSARIGIVTHSFVHAGSDFADELMTLRSGDVVIVLAYGRLHRHVKVLMERATSLQVPIVLVTDRLNGDIVDGVDVVLNAGRGSPGLFASHGTTIVLLEAFIIGLAGQASSNAERTLEELNDVRAALAGRRLDVDPR